MRKDALLKGLLAGLMLFSTPALAVPFAVMEPQSFAMGGTGVASAKRANAVFFNPALLAASRAAKDYQLSAPLLATRMADKDSAGDSLDYYQDNLLESAYDTALNNFKTGNYTDLAAARTAVAQSAFNMLDRIESMVGKPQQSEFVAGLVLGIPNDRVAASVFIGNKVIGGAQVDPGNDLAELERVIEAASTGALSTGETFDSTQLTATLQGRGLEITEIGVALAREYDVRGEKIAFGVTPKLLKVTSFDYAEPLNIANFDSDKGQRDHTAIDVDLGASRDYGNGWRSGVALKNLIGQKYETAIPGHVIKVKPQARLGVSHHTQYVLVALDMDLNESKSLGFDSPSQYLAFGAELNVVELVRLRIGYRHNMSDTDTSMATAGVGFAAYGAQVDLAAGANEDEIGLAAQMRFAF